MIKQDDLYKISGQGLVFLEIEKSKFDDFLNIYRLDKNKKNVVICLRGKKMKNIDALFSEFAAAFQFPSYFGENWQALDECINDLGWLPGDNYIIGINDIQELLIEEETKELDVLLKILQNACSNWSKPKDITEVWGRTAKPFHILMQYSAKNSEKVEFRFKKGLGGKKK